jgi:hypothetical protein
MRFSVMDSNLSALERAFQLARSGQVSNVEDIRKRLKHEGYDANAVFVGKSLKTQLRDLIKAAHLESTDAAKS